MVGPEIYQDIFTVLRGDCARVYVSAPSGGVVDSGISLVVEEQCPVCMGPYTNPYAYACGHLACKECWSLWQARQLGGPPTCVICRSKIAPAPGAATTVAVQQHNEASLKHHEKLAEVVLGAAKTLTAHFQPAADSSKMPRSAGKLHEYDPLTPEVTDLTSCVQYLLSGKVPIIPAFNCRWDAKGSSKDVHNFVALIATIYDDHWSATSEARRQWLTLVRVFDDALVDGNFLPSDTSPHLLYHEVDLWFRLYISDHDVLHNQTIYGGVDDDVSLLSTYEREHGPYMLLCHFIVYRQYQRYLQRRVENLS